MPKQTTDLAGRVSAAATQLTAPASAQEGRHNNVISFLNDGNTAKQMARLLGTEATAERFMRIALTLCRQNPKLLACTMESFAGALMTCAQLKLEPGPPLGLAWLVPYTVNKKEGGAWKKVQEVQFQIGYPGIVQLAMRSGQLASISAQSVCEGDEFGFDYLSGEKHHKPPTRGLRGKAIGFYCHAQFQNGGEHFLYVTREEMLKHRDRYAATKAQQKGPWYDDADLAESPLFDAMGRKTVVRMSRAYLPASADFVAALTADERVVRVDRAGKIVFDDEELAGIGLEDVAALEAPEQVVLEAAASDTAPPPAQAPAPAPVAAPPILVACPDCATRVERGELERHKSEHHGGDLGPVEPPMFDEVEAILNGEA